MGYTLTLTDYVNQTSTELITAMQLKGETADLCNIVPNVKSAQALQILTNSPVPQDGTSCAFNASGDSAFTQRNIVTKPVKYQDLYCTRALEAKWTQLLLKSGQKYDETDIPAMIIEDITKQIVANNEKMDWQGDTTNWSAFIKQYDGFIKIIKAATGTNVATAVAGPVTTSNVRTIMANIVAKIGAVPVLVGNPNVKIMCGYDIAELYRQKIFADNLYHVTGQGDQKRMMAEGSVHEIIPVHGLDGLGAGGTDAPFIFALDPARNLYLGCDLQGEEEKAEMGMDQYNENAWYTFRFRRGVQIAIPSEIVEYSNT